MRYGERGSRAFGLWLYRHCFISTNVEFNDAACRRSTCKRKLYWFSGDEASRLGSCDRAEVAAFEM